ncbi:hypothetical protein PpBr36_07214 [Pyricularia pennisetigena]|uniref:hypothetical protein n=1 Tax=Pyricularia pennisetigena TaxID=1578925 RepID=UPI0011524E8C|nr:hypothetical protein PpBr36_07214 [Pyricularia pennisetigena]TLS25953.1 hypothetical protein PpBr36_07214 [Pyricularia pennisetigena]
MKASRPAFHLLLLTLLSTFCQAISITDVVAQLPPCGLQCIAQGVSSSPCHDLTNANCLCQDTDLYNRAQTCVLTNCTGPDALKTGRLQAELCKRPLRLRKVELHALNALHGLALAVIFLRLYGRWYALRTFGNDDWVALVILLAPNIDSEQQPLFIVQIFIGNYVGHMAFGIDIWWVDTDTLTDALRVFYFGETVYVLLLGLTKISILFFFLRVFPPPNFRRLTYITIGFLSLSTAALDMAQILQCNPVDKAWYGWQEPGFLVNGGSSSCISVNALTYASAGVSIFFDVVILLLPLPIILGLDATRRLRAEIVVMLSVGVLVLITSCVRMRYIALFADSTNPTWDATDAILWSGIEISVAVICISLPAIRVLLRSFCRTGTPESSPFRSPPMTRRSRRFSIKSDAGAVPEQQPRRKKETKQESSSSSTGNRDLRVRVEDLRAEFGDDIALEMTSGPHARAIDRIV